MERDPRLNKVCNYMTKMMDVKIRRHPLRLRVIITLCDVNRDHYGDPRSTPVEKLSKLVILRKNVDMDYINNAIGVLLEDGEHLPWIMILTLTGMPRTLRHGDYVTIEDLDYKISGVKPVNRENPDIIACFLHPERDDFDPREDLPTFPGYDRLI